MNRSVVAALDEMRRLSRSPVYRGRVGRLESVAVRSLALADRLHDWSFPPHAAGADANASVVTLAAARCAPLMSSGDLVGLWSGW